MDKIKKLRNFIKEKPYLIWYVKDLDNLSKESIVETVLNYGDFNDVQKMIAILGVNEVAKIFKQQTKNNKRCNYSSKTKNYFQLYFQKYA